MMCPVGGSSALIPLLLISMSTGYATLTLSAKQEGPLDKLGRLVGGLVLIVSFVSLLCFAYCMARVHFGSCGNAPMACHMPAAADSPN